MLLPAKTDKPVVPLPFSRSNGLPVGNKRCLIAIVEDDQYVRGALKGLMRSMGFSVEAFSSGPDFLTSSQIGRISCLIADVNMPEMNGLNLYRKLLSLGYPIPTILITSYPNESTRTLALEAGVISYLVKPFAEADLLEGVRTALDLKQ